MDQYYEGAKNRIQHANVRAIINANVLSLLENPDRKFNEVEQAFFQMWYDEQPEARKADVRSLVDRGQLEFINGGWSMHVRSFPPTALQQRPTVTTHSHPPHRSRFRCRKQKHTHTHNISPSLPRTRPAPPSLT